MTARDPHPLVARLHARRHVHRQRSKVVRVVYAVAGSTVLAAGVAMLVLPGPAFAVIPLGLFLLALEFAWAERALVRSLEQAERARIKATETTRTQRVLAAAATTLAAGGLATWALLGDIPVVPV